MTDEEFIEKIFTGSYVHPHGIQMIHPVYKNTEVNGFVFYVITPYEEIQSMTFKTKREAVESRDRLIKIVHFFHK